MLQDQIEVGPAALLVAGGGAETQVDVAPGQRIRRREPHAVDDDSMGAEGGGDALPVRNHENAAGIEKERVNGHNTG